MFRSFARIALLATPMILAGPAFAQNTDTESTTAEVSIIRPLVLTKEDDLNFGRIARGTGDNTITIAASADTVVVTGTGGAASAPGTGVDTAKRAHFTITGEDATGYTVTIPANVNLSKGSGDPIVLTLTNSLTADPNKGVIGTDDEFFVGGSFPITALTESGAYTATFDVIATYN